MDARAQPGLKKLQKIALIGAFLLFSVLSLPVSVVIATLDVSFGEIFFLPYQIPWLIATWMSVVLAFAGCFLLWRQHKNVSRFPGYQILWMAIVKNACEDDLRTLDACLADLPTEHRNVVRNAVSRQETLGVCWQCLDMLALCERTLRAHRRLTPAMQELIAVERNAFQAILDFQSRSVQVLMAELVKPPTILPERAIASTATTVSAVSSA